MNHKVANGLGFLAVGLSAFSVVYLLVLEKLAWVDATLVFCAVVLGTLVLLTMVPRKSHFAFLEICREKTPFLYTRLVVSIVLFLAGWYIQSAMAQVFGADHAAVLVNEKGLLCPLFSMFGHIIWAGCVKKAKTL